MEPEVEEGLVGWGNVERKVQPTIKTFVDSLLKHLALSIKYNNINSNNNINYLIIIYIYMLYMLYNMYKKVLYSFITFSCT